MADTQGLVNIVDPDTNKVGSIPQSQLQAALNQGYRQAEKKEVDSYFNEQQYGTPLEMAKTFGEGAASAATFGLSTKAEKILGAKPEDIRARRETNPISYGAGQVAGVVAPTILAPELPFAGKALGAMGEAGATAAGLGGAGAGVASRIGATALKGAIESSVFQGGDEVSKYFSDDPEQARAGVGAAAANVGLAGILGGALGVPIGAAGELWNATVGKKLGSLTAAANEINGTTPKVSEAITPDTTTPVLRTAAENAQTFGGTGETAPIGAVERARQSADNLGIKLTPGMLTTDEGIRGTESELAKRYSAQRAEYDHVFKGLNTAGEDLLSGKTDLSQIQNGRDIGESLVKDASAKLKPLEQRYEAIKPQMKAAVLSDEVKVSAADKLLNNDFVLENPNSDTSKFYKKLSDEILDIRSVDGIKSKITEINAKLQTAIGPGGDRSLVGPLNDAKTALKQLQSDGFSAAEKAGLVPEGSFENLQQLNKEYAGVKNIVKSAGGEASLGNVGSARDIVNKLSKVADEKIEGRIFNPKDYSATLFFKENFPEAYEKAKSGFLREIYEKSLGQAMGQDNLFQIQKFRAQINKLSPEIQSELFGNKTSLIQDIDNIYARLPKDINPAGTASAKTFVERLSPKGLLQEGTDAAQYAYLKALPHLADAMASIGGDTEAAKLATLKFAANAGNGVNERGFGAAAKFIQASIKGAALVNRATNSVIDGASIVLPSKATDKIREDLDKKLKDLQANISPMLGIGSDVAHYMPVHGSAIAETSASAVQYLNSLRPSVQAQSPLDAKPVISKAQQASYNRALDIASQPLLLMKDVKNGMITAADVTHISHIYPGLYKTLVSKMNTAIIDATHNGRVIPYKTRMGISIFMGAPLDSTMNPAGIRLAQPIVRQTKTQGMSASKSNSLTNIAQQDFTPLQARQMNKAPRR
jgi:hypothetical protein